MIDEPAEHVGQCLPCVVPLMAPGLPGESQQPHIERVEVAADAFSQRHRYVGRRDFHVRERIAPCLTEGHRPEQDDDDVRHDRENPQTHHE